MRKDNYLYFVNSAENVLDNGARQISSVNKLPRLESLAVAQPKFINVNKKFHIVIPLRNEQRESLTDILTLLKLSLENLNLMLIEKNIETFSLSKTDSFENISFATILNVF